MPREHALELLFFGFVRPYKGLDVLLEALAMLPRDLDVRLTVAGEFWHGAEEARAQISRLGIGNRVTIVDRYLPQEEVADYFARADAIVLPYRSATGSGVVAIAYHYEKPVIVTAVGGLPDVVEEGVTGFLVPPEDPRALADTIARLPDADLDRMAVAARRFKESRLSWAGMARTVLDARGAGPVPGGVSWRRP
jgi:glycosyltransferase involved in cell wall biosynthesis